MEVVKKAIVSVFRSVVAKNIDRVIPVLLRDSERQQLNHIKNSVCSFWLSQVQGQNYESEGEVTNHKREVRNID